MAKLVCGINKPNKQTVLPHASVPELFSQTKLKKVRNLGGKFGDTLVEKLKCETMADLAKLTEKELSLSLGAKNGYAVLSSDEAYLGSK
jgi:DNA polymerase eta